MTGITPAPTLTPTLALHWGTPWWHRNAVCGFLNTCKGFILFWLYLRRLSLLETGLFSVFFLPQLMTFAWGPRRPRARGVASAHTTRRHLTRATIELHRFFSEVPQFWSVRPPKNCFGGKSKSATGWKISWPRYTTRIVGKKCSFPTILG